MQNLLFLNFLISRVVKICLRKVNKNMKRVFSSRKWSASGGSLGHPSFFPTSLISPARQRTQLLARPFPLPYTKPSTPACPHEMLVLCLSCSHLLLLYSQPKFWHTPPFLTPISANQEQCKSFTNTVASPSGSNASSCSPQHACLAPCSLSIGFGSPKAGLTSVVLLLQQNRKTWALWMRKFQKKKISALSLAWKYPKIADACSAVYFVVQSWLNALFDQ